MIVRNMPITHVDPRTGIVSESPRDVAVATSIALGRTIHRDVSALARMLATSTPTGNERTAMIRAHVALNDLADFNRVQRLGWTLEQLLTHSSSNAERDRFGEIRKGRRRYGTSTDATEGHVLAAELAIAEHGAARDRAAGAVRFLDRKLTGRKHGRRSLGDLTTRWAREGLERFYLPEHGGNFVLFRRRTS